ncbi:hypothetical protein PRUPE_2G074000 [Prunus persica]|uniref:Uncharacterized protein n=1 Tax=Prunus persica TaxID=3760 RepID=M5X651_PRUPE|nr:hypothetical protein PRUPE_2G074000 [Prunus persica]
MTCLLNELTLNANSLSSSPNSQCIYKVLERLRQGDDKFFTPYVVSVGPLHPGKEHLKAMTVHKKKYLQDFLEYLLVENDIIELGLGEEEQVAAIFIRFGKEVDIESNCFVEAIISLVVAGFLTILIVIQQCSIIFVNHLWEQIFSSPITARHVKKKIIS